MVTASVRTRLSSSRKKKIRRKSLRCFYGNSVYSPNLVPVEKDGVSAATALGSRPQGV